MNHHPSLSAMLDLTARHARFAVRFQGRRSATFARAEATRSNPKTESYTIVDGERETVVCCVREELVDELRDGLFAVEPNEDGGYDLTRTYVPLAQKARAPIPWSVHSLRLSGEVASDLLPLARGEVASLTLDQAVEGWCLLTTTPAELALCIATQEADVVSAELEALRQSTIAVRLNAAVWFGEEPVRIGRPIDEAPAITGVARRWAQAMPTEQKLSLLTDLLPQLAAVNARFTFIQSNLRGSGDVAIEDDDIHGPIHLQIAGDPTSLVIVHEGWWGDDATLGPLIVLPDGDRYKIYALPGQEAVLAAEARRLMNPDGAPPMDAIPRGLIGAVDAVASGRVNLVRVHLQSHFVWILPFTATSVMTMTDEDRHQTLADLAAGFDHDLHGGEFDCCWQAVDGQSLRDDQRYDVQPLFDAASVLDAIQALGSASPGLPT